MASIPRIMVVDAANTLGDLIRPAMVMLKRRCLLIESPTAEDALKEIEMDANIDLAVAAYQLDGTTGIEWAKTAIREQAGTPIIVVASDQDNLPSRDDLGNIPSQIQFLHNFSGEDLLRALRIGLDGAEVVAAEEGLGATVDLGPIPTLNVDAALPILRETTRDIGALGALISDRAGRLVVDEGATGYINKSQIAALLGPSFAQLAKIAPDVGGETWGLRYIEGERYNIFALGLGYHYFMLFLIDASNRGAMGAVMNFGRKGANKIIEELLGDDAWTFSAAATQPIVTTPVATPPTPVAAPPQKPQPVVQEEVVPAAPIVMPSLFEEDLEPVDNLDLDMLFGQELTDDAFDDVFSNDLLEKSSGNIGADSSVSYEEAQNMGLLGD
jgi:hypothetical protein